MPTVQFNFNRCYIVHKRANRHSNSVLNKLRKLIDLPGATGENVSVINILQNSTCFLRSWHEKVSKVLLHPQTPHGKAYSAPSYPLSVGTSQETFVDHFWKDNSNLVVTLQFLSLSWCITFLYSIYLEYRQWRFFVCLWSCLMYDFQFSHLTTDGVDFLFANQAALIVLIVCLFLRAAHIFSHFYFCRPRKGVNFSEYLLFHCSFFNMALCQIKMMHF